MADLNSAQAVAADKYDAWLFDLDGVITDTAAVHAASWKQMFDQYLQHKANRDGTSFLPFQLDPGYFLYVDGKPRYNGVDSFLRSRNTILEWGDPGDGPDIETVCGLGNRKNIIFNDLLKKQGAVVFKSSIDLIDSLKSRGKRIAVVTSSKNCNTVLRVAGLLGLFDAQVDGIVAAKRKLKGKPDPHTYKEAARDLGIAVDRSVVLEDAISGVKAGKEGGFGLVIGVARHDEPQVLLDAGADIVVSDLSEIVLK